MALFFTSNRLTTDAAAVVPGELLDGLSVKAWAGQVGEPASFRIGNSGTEDASLPLYSTSVSVELSSDRRYWGGSLSYSVAAGKVGDTVYVRALASLDELERDETAYIVADADRLRIDFYLAGVNEGDTDKSQSYRYAGENTREVREFFETDGEAVRVIEYEPLAKPDRGDLESGYVYDLNRYSIREWCNPLNEDVGFVRRYWHAKAFVGDRQTFLNAAYNLEDLRLNFGDSNAILLPDNFEGFNPTWQKNMALFSQVAPNQWAFQPTVWTIWRDNVEYALRNIRRIGFFKGQILFWLADLVRVQFPGGASTESFLPWNELVDPEWKPIAYVPEWSSQYDEDPYATQTFCIECTPDTYMQAINRMIRNYMTPPPICVKFYRNE